MNTGETMKFYVYRIFNEYGDTLYIGKGSSSRLARQIKRFGFFGEELKRFADEAACLAEEIRLIAKHSPPLNKTKGGERGGREIELNIFFELARLCRISKRQNLPYLVRIVSRHVERIGFEKCRDELAKYKVTLLPPLEAVSG